MLLFTALIATLNLCVGYALGVYIGEFPGLPRRKPADLPEPSLDLSTPAETPPAAAPRPAEPAEKSVDPPAPEPAHDAATAQPPAKPPGAKQKATPKEVMASMSAFQAQLAKMGSELKRAADDEAAFGECAGRLQQANHDYLEQAQSTIDRMDDPASSDCREALAENTRRVGETSSEIDKLLDEGVADAQGREAVIDKTAQLGADLAEGEQKVREAAGHGDGPDTAAAASPNQPVEPESALASLEAVESAIAEALAGGDSSLIVASMRRDEFDAAGSGEDEIEQRLFNALAKIAQEVLDDSHIAAAQSEDRLVMVLKGDGVDQATERIERLRQQVEKTTFMAGKSKLSATVTCALAEASEDSTGEELLEHLADALSESDRHGPNRSYHHDGHFPAPVMPEEISIRGRTVKL